MSWRVGKRVRLNVYDGDRPVCQCHTEQDALLVAAAVGHWLKRFAPPVVKTAVVNEAAKALLDSMHERYRWRPIAELHEDFGPCAGVDINDPGYLVIVHANDTEPDEAVTHFARFAPLTNEQAAAMQKEMAHEASGVDPDYERLLTA